MRKMCISLVFVVSLGSPAIAETAAMGFGLEKCSTYLDRTKKSGDVVRKVYFQWGLGLMSGLNAYLTGRTPPQATDLSALDTATQVAAIHEYCERHPDRSYASAVLFIFDTLRKGQNLADWRDFKKE